MWSLSDESATNLSNPVLGCRAICCSYASNGVSMRMGKGETTPFWSSALLDWEPGRPQNLCPLLTGYHAKFDSCTSDGMGILDNVATLLLLLLYILHWDTELSTWEPYGRVAQNLNNLSQIYALSAQKISSNPSTSFHVILRLQTQRQ